MREGIVLKPGVTEVSKYRAQQYKFRLGHLFPNTISADRSILSILSIYAFDRQSRTNFISTCAREVAMAASFRAKVWGSVSTFSSEPPTLHSFFSLSPSKSYKVRPIFSDFVIRLLRSFFTRFIFFEAPLSPFAHAHFEPLLCDLLVCSKASLSALIILLTIPTKANAGSSPQFPLHSCAIATSYGQSGLPQCLFTVSAL